MSIDKAIANERAEADKARESEALFLRDGLIWNAKEAHKHLEERKQYTDWLEELKAYREIGTVEKCRNSVLDIDRAYNKGYADGSLSVTSEIRNKVIDECLGVLYRNGGKIISIRFYEEIFKEMEHLKAGGENEI